MCTAMLRMLGLPAAILVSVAAAPSIAASLQANGTDSTALAHAGIITGARVRVQAPEYYQGDSKIGMVGAVQDTAFVFHRESQSDSIPLSLAKLGRLDVSVARFRHPAAGLQIGVATGVVLGSVIGLESYTATSPSRAEAAVGGALIMGTLGGIIGYYAGKATLTDKWQPVPLTNLVKHANAGVDVIPVPTGRRYALRLGAHF
jgi:hypothetical protein